MNGLEKVESFSHESFASYLLDYRSALWVHLAILISFLGVLGAFYSPDSPMVIGKTIPVVLLLGFVPGYSSQRAIFPRRDLSTLEQILLSILLSIIVSISVGTVLGFLHVFLPATNAVALGVYSTIAAIVAGYRSFKYEMISEFLESGLAKEFAMSSPSVTVRRAVPKPFQAFDKES